MVFVDLYSELNVKTIKNNLVTVTTDDFLWIHLMMVSDDSESSNYEKYTIYDFSAAMRKLGFSYFRKIDVWFMVLVLCGKNLN
jgi:hypothetical protein